jgi:hypothetical protein
VSVRARVEDDDPAIGIDYVPTLGGHSAGLGRGRQRSGRLASREPV